MGLEQQLNNIASKALMHQFIDELPDGVQGVLATLDPGDSDSTVTVSTLGPISRRDVLWITHMVALSIVPTGFGPEETL